MRGQNERGCVFVVFFLLFFFVYSFKHSGTQVLQHQSSLGKNRGRISLEHKWMYKFSTDLSKLQKFELCASLPDNSSPIADYQALELASKLKGINVYLVGLMGTGKTAVGQVLAKKLKGYAFVDTDSVIENVAKKSIPVIFEESGEAHFRQLESNVLDQVCAFVRCVVGTGGGIVCKQENWAYLQTGVVVWLNMEVEDIVDRLKRNQADIDNRPLLKTSDPLKKLEHLLEQRKSFYEQADVTVNIAPFMDVEMVASCVIENTLEMIAKNPPKWEEWKQQAEKKGIL